MTDHSDLIEQLQAAAEITGDELLLAAADALSSLRKGAEVAVKPLEWRHDNAHSIIGRYWITYTGGKIGLHLDQRKIGKFADPDEAKAAAQSDFETRIRSALVSGSREDGE